MLRYVTYVLRSPVTLRNTSSTFFRPQVMRKGKIHTSQQVAFIMGVTWWWFWDEMKKQQFYLVCNSGCAPKKHKMGCLRKKMPDWFLARFSTLCIADWHLKFFHSHKYFSNVWKKYNVFTLKTYRTLYINGIETNNFTVSRKLEQCNEAYYLFFPWWSSRSRTGSISSSITW